MAVFTVIWDNIPGYVIETGVWRGGASMLDWRINATQCRNVYFCDSFLGTPSSKGINRCRFGQGCPEAG